MKSVDFERAFKDIGYTWTDESPFSPRPLTGYVFEPVTVDYLKSDDSKNNVVVINANARITCDIKNNNKMKQVSMNDFIKTIK